MIFEYQPSRSGKHPWRFIVGFKRYLQVDCHSGYHDIPDIRLAGCWAHLRRKFDEALNGLVRGGVRWKAVLSRSIRHLLDRELARYVPALGGEWTKMLAEKGLGKKDIAVVKPELLKREAGKKKKVKPGWLKFGFPRTYNTDLLEVLYVLARQGPDGRWRNDKSLAGKLGPGVEFEPHGAPSRYLTLEALRILKQYG